MNITVFGANGKVGSKVVNLLIKDQHNVRAFVYGSHSFEDYPNLEIVQGDIRDRDQVLGALVNTDLVVSALGSWGTKTKDIQVAGMTNIVPAMKEKSVKRIISLTGSDAYVLGDKKSLLFLVTHLILSFIAGKILKDGENHTRMLQESDLDWTVVRSPVMNESGNPANFKLNTKRNLPWETINRNSVALSMVELVNSNEYTKKSPFIKRNKS